MSLLMGFGDYCRPDHNKCGVRSVLNRTFVSSLGHRRALVFFCFIVCPAQVETLRLVDTLSKKSYLRLTDSFF
jgi:hypothetical protein